LGQTHGMLRAITDLPTGVIGFEAVGEVHSDDYRDVLRPAIDAAAAAGPVRLVYVLGPEFTGYSAGAEWQDAKLGAHHLSAWERAAVVSDVEWVEHLVGAFAWLIPGELRRFSLAERDEAVNWAAGIEPQPEPVPAPVAVEPVAEPATAETPAAAAPAAAFGGAETVTPTAPMAPGADMRPGMATPAPPTAPAVPEQWAADPSGRHQHRWWNGHEWTEHVADNGISGIDPLS
jgi:hypothetical protein